MKTYNDESIKLNPMMIDLAQVGQMPVRLEAHTHATTITLRVGRESALVPTSHLCAAVRRCQTISEPIYAGTCHACNGSGNHPRQVVGAYKLPCPTCKGRGVL